MARYFSKKGSFEEDCIEVAEDAAETGESGKEAEAGEGVVGLPGESGVRIAGRGGVLERVLSGYGSFNFLNMDANMSDSMD